jgi:hypothetical protein
MVSIAITTLMFVWAGVAVCRAHSGPPYPAVWNQLAGPYQVTVWTDPDATDDGSAAGRFWVTVQPAGQSGAIPADTRATISVWPAEDRERVRRSRTELVDNDPSRQYAALVLDHEGGMSVRVDIDGSLGAAEVDTDVQATYDLRPPPMLLAVYVMPFLLTGFLWVKLLLRRRGLGRGVGNGSAL